MQPLRAMILDRHRLAVAVLVLALLIKAMIPAGFMVSASPDRVLTVTICSDTPGGLKQMQLVIPAKKQGQDQGSGHGEPAQKADQCAFTGLGHAALGAADAVLLALAFAFILVLGLAPARQLPFRQIAYLRPPLRGPPAPA